MTSEEILEGNAKPVIIVNIKKIIVPDFVYQVTEQTWMDHRFEVQEECLRQYKLHKSKYKISDNDVLSHQTTTDKFGIITQTVKFKNTFYTA